MAGANSLLWFNSILIPLLHLLWYPYLVPKKWSGGLPKYLHVRRPLLDVGINLIPFGKGTVFHSDPALQQPHVDFLIGEGAVDDEGVSDQPPHGAPGIIHYRASAQDHVLRCVRGVFRIGVFA